MFYYRGKSVYSSAKVSVSAGRVNRTITVKIIKHSSSPSVSLLWYSHRLQYVLLGRLFSLHHSATLKPLLLHSSTCFDHKTMFCSCLNVLIPFFIGHSPIFSIADARIQSSTTFIIHIFPWVYLSDKTGCGLTVTLCYLTVTLIRCFYLLTVIPLKIQLGILRILCYVSFTIKLSCYINLKIIC